MMKGPMSEALSSWHPHDLEKRGIPSDELIRVYEKWAPGGWGIILSEWHGVFSYSTLKLNLLISW
jgi:2,4-dienoyl-CoA reductase-like NADH-dependent reductase (Old Yellow Enzyme family)